MLSKRNLHLSGNAVRVYIMSLSRIAQFETNRFIDFLTDVKCYKNVPYRHVIDVKPMYIRYEYKIVYYSSTGVFLCYKNMFYYYQLELIIY